LTSDPDLTERFYLAWRDADYVALGDLLAPDAQWIMNGRSRFAGRTNGRDAIIEMRRQIGEITDDTWRALRDYPSATIPTTSSQVSTTRSQSIAS
jgi:ketosteroid isomerase-like protein